MGKTGDCGSCKDSGCEHAGAKSGGLPEFRYFADPRAQPGGSRYLEEGSKKGPKPDATSLDGPCPHFEFGPAPRSQCNECIISWVLAVGKEAAEKTAVDFVKTHRSVAAERIRKAIVEHLEAA